MALNVSMSQAGLPHNAGVRELIAGKRKWASSLTIAQAKVADSFPTSLRLEWQALLQIEDNYERRRQLQAYLDKGRGECPLTQPRLASLVEDAFRYHHGNHYELRAWVVMPNHVHILFKIGDKPMGNVIAGWKEYTTRAANKLLNRRGKFWAADYWDTFMRSPEHELLARNYAELNPVKAGLVRAAKDWPWSSARFRDEYGHLRFESP